jgi:hypothetical protein
MGAHISFIAYRFSSVTDDSLTVGLFYSDINNKANLFISNEKLKILKKLISLNMYKNICQYLKKIEKHNLILSDLIYLSTYQNGYVKVTKPTPFGGKEELAKSLFDNHININYK